MPKKKLDTLLGRYQGNAFPAMYDDLAKHLGVSAESLSRLALGWAPIVEFKKGPNFQGWWVIPERDSDGEVVGLSLRSQTDMKVMYPGSKHGLTYEVNPNHEQGGGGYAPGPHNWIRLIDADLPCPVCGRPDGCLLHRDNPEDPQAVVCIREKSDRETKFGYLHILKDEGRLNTASSALADNGGPVLIVEGMTDTAAARDLGFDAVGRPSNLACMDMLNDLVRGRDVIVVGENDKKDDGSEPGREGMIAAFQIVKKAAKSIKMVMPPDHIKDLRGWVRKGVTKEEFLEYADEEGQDRTEQTVLPDDQPLTLARQYLDTNFRMAGRYLMKYQDGKWCGYTGTKYKELTTDRVRGPMYDWAEGKSVMFEKASGESSVQKLDFRKGTVSNMMDAMLSPRLCQIDTEEMPTWINGASGPDPADLITFANGILWVSKYLAGAPESEYLLPLSPDYFTLFALPYPLDPTATCPTLKYILRTSLGDEREKPMLFREWMGYNLTPLTRYQKFMIMRGPTASGKSTLTHVMRHVVGFDQAADPKFRDLMEQFGLEGLVGAQLAVMDDANLPRQGDAVQALETILKITGEDRFNVPRKFMTPLRGYKFNCKFTLTTNALPELPDHAGALQRRLLFLDFKKSFKGKEDDSLRDKLIDEAPGIAVWALGGLKRLREQGHFTVPPSMKEALGEWRTATSPCAAFIEDACDPEEGAETNKRELFDAFNQWCDERNIRSTTFARFRERLAMNATYVVSDSYEKGGHKFSVFRNIKLKKWAARAYVGRPER